jgi:hypothetical protein
VAFRDEKGADLPANVVASGISLFVGLLFAGVILVVSLVVAIFFPAWWGAVGYTIAIYTVFAIMALSSWCIEVHKNDAWAQLGELEQYLLHRHRAFFYFPFGASNFGHFCNWTRIFVVPWAIFCAWRGWYWLSAALALFYAVSTPMITIWIPIPYYQRCVQRGHQWAQERLNAMQHVLDERNALRF